MTAKKIKYPRVVVSHERHAALKAEAKGANKPISEILEEKLKRK